MVANSACQVFAEAFEERAPAVLQHGWAVGPVDVGALMGEAQGGAVASGNELEGEDGDLDGLGVETHPGSSDDARVGSDVLIGGVVGDFGTGDGMAFLEAVAITLGSTDAELHFKLLDFVVAFGVPAAFAGWLCKGGEDALGRLRVVAFEDEGAVDYGGVGHWEPP